MLGWNACGMYIKATEMNGHGAIANEIEEQKRPDSNIRKGIADQRI
jgi:hypothetical protein